MKKILKGMLGATMLSFTVCTTAIAATWPEKALKIVVPYAPGGNTDTVGRILADGLSKELGQAVVVENRPGATALIGTNFVADSPADGYTYLLNTISLIMSPHIFNSIKGDLHSKFEPVSQISSISKILVVNPSFPAKNIAEFLAVAKQAEKPLSYGTTGVGSSNHLMGELFAMNTGIEFMHVPYGSSSPAINDLIAKEIDFIFEDLPPVSQFILGNRLKALMVASKEKNSLFPNVPSAVEEGFDWLIVEPWNGVLAPKGTPTTIIDAMDAAIRKVVQSPEYKERMANMGALAVYKNSADYALFIQQEYDRWGEVVRKAGIPKQ